MLTLHASFSIQSSVKLLRIDKLDTLRSGGYLKNFVGRNWYDRPNFDLPGLAIETLL